MKLLFALPHFQLKKIVICLLFIVFMQPSYSEEDSEPRKMYRIRTMGDIGRFYIPAIAGGISLLKSDYVGVGQLYLDYVVTNLTIAALKRIFHTTRPNGDKYSFPSGHTGDAFVGAGYLHMRYGFSWGAPAYIAASFVAY